MKKYIFGSLLALFATCTVAKAEVEVSGGVDLVTSTVWRGAAASTGPSYQPSATVSMGGFSVTAWASQTFSTGDDNYSELDFTFAYSVGGFTAAYTNYWWTGCAIPSLYDSATETYGTYKYFQKHSHLSEVTLAYEFGESFPLSLSWNTIFEGDGDEDEDGDQYYSTYIEVAYPFSVKGIDCTAKIGVTPWEGMYSYSETSDFAVASVGVNCSKEIAITEKFSLPLFVDLSFSPANRDAFMVAGMSFGF